ncbi:HNH endonuclease signature motif containing protein [Burkholderia sp. SRS-25]|uniref:HNH endonuclease n=1 Tax=Burkholderia sp. SRS-25 TaxID=2094190 RepID=UPI0010501A41|nr:HNH endonuclease signature motif containing protein [Burkholderia sp. SRS-25]TCW64256.1 HNH endonuclease [Burkholderia sp. SRS-25]
MSLDNKLFSKRYKDGKQAVMIQLTANQRPDQFSFNAKTGTLSTGYWPAPVSEYDRVIVYKKAEAGESARVWIGDDAGLIYDEERKKWHYRARNVSAFTTTEDFQILFGLHPPQSVRYLYPSRRDFRRVKSFVRGSVVDSDDVLKVPANTATTVKRLQQARLHQQRFRHALFLRWKGACAVTGIEEPLLLRASHIKPYKDSTAIECISAHNGLLLTAGLDALFDKGFITFDERGKLLRSASLTRETATAFGLRAGMRLTDALSDDAEEYMQHHRDEVFLKA